MVTRSELLAAEYSAAADAYARHWAPVIRPMSLPMVEALASVTAQHVLDFGCGTGEILPQLRRAFPKACIVGVDPSEGMLRIARRIADCRLANMDGQQLAIRCEAFDVAILAFVLFHLPDPTEGLRETCRVLRVGGTAGAVTWGKVPDDPWVAIWNESLEAHGAGPDPRDSSVMRHALMDTPEKLSELFQEAGFDSVRVWSQDFAHQWTVERLLRLQLACGMPARRLATLSDSAKAACRAQVEERLSVLPPEDLVARPRVLSALGRRPV